MPYPEKTARNEEIFRLIESGESFTHVAEKFLIHPTRVLQIYNATFRKKFSSLNLNYKEEKNHG